MERHANRAPAAILAALSLAIFSLPACAGNLEEYPASAFPAAAARTGFFIASNGSFASNASPLTANFVLRHYNPSTSKFIVGTLFAVVVAPNTTIGSHAIRPLIGFPNDTVGLYISAVNTQGVWARVVLPNSTEIQVALANGSWTPFYFTALEGRYNVTFYSTDEQHLNATANDYFEIYEPVFFNATLSDSNGNPLAGGLRAYYRGNNLVNATSSTTGSLSLSVPKATFDLEFLTFDSGLWLRFESVDIVAIPNATVQAGVKGGIEDFIIAIGTNSSLFPRNATVTINYTWTGSLPDSLGLFRCENFTMATLDCGEEWQNITGEAAIDAGRGVLVTNTSVPAAYAIRQLSPPAQPVSPVPSALGGIVGTILRIPVLKTPTPTPSPAPSCPAEEGNCTAAPMENVTCPFGRLGTENCEYSCSNGVFDAGESDIDCGGACSPCGKGQLCGINGDCESGACKEGRCWAEEKEAQEIPPIIERLASCNQAHPESCTAALTLLLVLALLLITLLILVETYAPVIDERFGQIEEERRKLPAGGAQGQEKEATEEQQANQAEKKAAQEIKQ